MTGDKATEILEELRKTNTLLLTLIEAIEQGNQRATEKAVGGGRGWKNHLTQDQKNDLEDEIDLDWWFLNYGEELLPAKYMHAFSATGGNVDDLYTKDEGDYLFSRMKDYLGETNKQGTHVFTYLGKVWCKREKNARNCFSMVPVKEKTCQCQFGNCTLCVKEGN